MPRLYCEPHGQEDEARVIERREQYRQEGESVLIVKGRLTNGPFLCDRCGVELQRGDPACLVSAYPRWIVEQMQGYDFDYERQYFTVERAVVAVYGAGWPVGKVTALFRGDNAWPM